MATITELNWASLTTAVNEIKSPNQFIKRRFFPDHEPVHTEDIEIGLFSGTRRIAPFVRKGAAAIMVAGHGESFSTVQAPNIRIKRPFHPNVLAFTRRPGTPIFSSGAGMQNTAIRQHIARDTQIMADMITNAEEWLCAMALRGQINYSVADEETYQITFPRLNTHNMTVAVFWNEANPKPQANIMTAKRLIADAVGLGISDAICGSEAASTIVGLLETNSAFAALLDNKGVSVGGMTLTEQYSDDGVLYMGRIAGINFWEYSRSAELSGVATDLIRPKYIEFIAGSRAAQRTLYYGAVPDFDANEGTGLFVGERFSKSWKEKDPSYLVHLTHSRPLPVPRRPNATLSMKVVSG